MKNQLSAPAVLYRFSVSMLISTFVCAGSYLAYEPMVATAAGQTASDSAVVTLNVNEGITITSPADTDMSTNLSVSVNSAIATTTWNVKTNAAAGYALKLTSTSTPAMQTAGGTSKIPDFTGGTPNVTPANWSIPSNSYQFGYSGLGTDVVAGFGTPTSGCGATSTPDVGLKYTAFVTSSAITLATRTSTTTTSGVDTTVCYAVQQNGSYAPSGVYTATITATATTL